MLIDLDLNLLHALHALLTEQHVTRAGRRIGLSQPAMSTALARLRRYFDDELLIRNGNRYHLTPVAGELLPSLDRMMALVSETLAVKQPFDPRTSPRELTIELSDYALFVLMRPLLAAAAAEAPGVRIRFTGIDRAPAAELRPAELVVAPPGLDSGAASVELWDDDWQVCVAADHPDVGDRISVDQLSGLTYAQFQAADAPNAADTRLEAQGVSLQVGASVGSLVGALFMVRDTSWFTLVPRRLVAQFGAAAGVRALDCPVALPPIAEHLYCPAHREGDAAVVWLRDLVRRVAAAL